MEIDVGGRSHVKTQGETGEAQLQVKAKDCPQLSQGRKRQGRVPLLVSKVAWPSDALASTCGLLECETLHSCSFNPPTPTKKR